MLEDEEYKLAQLETEAQAIAEEADRAAAKPNPKNDQRQADRIARLQKKADGAKKRAAALRLVIEGPLPTPVRVYIRQPDTECLCCYVIQR